MHYATLLTQVLLLMLWCCIRTATDQGDMRLLPNKLLNILSQYKNRLQRHGFRRDTRSELDLRGHRLFMSNPQVDCCPTVTGLIERTMGINQQGLVLELFYSPNFTQTFYETICHPAIKDRPCQFIDERYALHSRCVQRYSYVYAMGRPYGNWMEQFKIDYIRVATGCKCQLSSADVVQEYG